jgi:hypothetical protein
MTLGFGGNAPAEPHASERWLAFHDLIRQKRKIILQDADDIRGTLHRVGYVSYARAKGKESSATPVKPRRRPNSES